MRSDEESTALVVPTEYAQTLRSELERLNLWDAAYKLKKLTYSDQIGIPIKPSKENMLVIANKWPDYKIVKMHLPSSKKVKAKENCPAAALRCEINQLLQQYGMSENLLNEVPSKWERHGDLVIIPAYAFSSPEWKLLGSQLWLTVAKSLACRRLARHSTVADDGFRSSKVTLLLGEDGDVTHVDNGIRYSYDVTKCMFSAGNITEKLRIASLDCSNEIIVDLYAGIGYFTLPYLVYAKAQHVHACEWNPNAIKALRNNLSLNGVSERCTVHEGDNRLLNLSAVADRVNLGLIPSSEDGWPVAVQVLKSGGGILHIHGNVTSIPHTLLSDSCGHCQEKNGHLAMKGDGHLAEKGDGHLAGKSEWHLAMKGDRHVAEKGDGHLAWKSDPYFTHQVGKSTHTNPESMNSVFEPHCKNLQESVTSGESEKKTSVTYGSDHLCVSATTEHTIGVGLYGAGKERSGKTDIRLACDKWSSEVQEKIKSLLEAVKGEKWTVKELHVEIVKSYAPHVVHAVIDLDCKPVADMPIAVQNKN